jgi:isochorismate synthase
MKQFEILQNCIVRNLPFFSYRMPYSHEIVTGIQTSSKIERFVDFERQKNGFIVAPFDGKSFAETLFFNPDIHFTNENIDSNELDKLLSITLDVKKSGTSTHETSQSDYLQQASTLIDKLKNKELEKVVLSRAVSNTSCNKNVAASVFEKLTKIYPHAFVSIFYIPGQCVWVGATPETLLKSSDEGIQTMSLAGTKSLLTKTEWTDKEREEQQMVSNYVENVLHQFSFSEIEKAGPTEQNAGNVCHLMTTYNCKGKISGNEQLKLIKTLHPTPAVCGIPKEKAIQLISTTELHDREYYAGFLGPINAKACNLFVNLRCMKLTDEGVAFFVGGGLTAQSVPEAEWNETCMKLETLSKVINSQQ